ncbi:hypothetical protein ACN20G_33465 (plasmid) [Streptomyces sp. BI20]|uniref:hypothetical protein n=1 Tax=Streptomyces sp. BI20 TaxID=3403460 RepID=UPI003C73F72E
MDPAVLRWLLAQLGPDTDTADLVTRYERLRSARAVADEVLSERIAVLLAEPLRVTVNGVATIDQAGNLAALERRLAQVRDVDGRAPDDAEAAVDVLSVVPLVARARR